MQVGCSSTVTSLAGHALSAGHTPSRPAGRPESHREVTASVKCFLLFRNNTKPGD